MNWLLRVTTKIKCQNGRVRLVCRDPEKAFPLFAQSKTLGVSVGADLVEQVKATAGVNYAKAIEGFLGVVDQVNGSLQTQFRALYVLYLADVCGEEAYEQFREEIRNVMERESLLRRLSVIFHHIKALLDAGLGGEALKEAISNALNLISQPTDIAQRLIARNEARADMQQWKGGSDG